MTTEPIRVLVVDDHPVFREGFAALLASIAEVEVVGTAGTGREALAAAADTHPTSSSWTCGCRRWTASRPPDA